MTTPRAATTPNVASGSAVLPQTSLGVAPPVAARVVAASNTTYPPDIVEAMNKVKVMEKTLDQLKKTTAKTETDNVERDDKVAALEKL